MRRSRNTPREALKRIKKLRFEFHEERRAKEKKAERENTEAFNYAQRLLEENNQIKEALQQHQEVLQKSQSERLATEVAAQRRRYKDAYESGDAEELAAAQEDLSRAVASHDRISSAPPPQRLQAAPPPEQPAPQPTVDEGTGLAERKFLVWRRPDNDRLRLWSTRTTRNSRRHRSANRCLL